MEGGTERKPIRGNRVAWRAAGSALAAYFRTSRLRIAAERLPASATATGGGQEQGRVALFAMSVHRVKLFGGSCARDWSGCSCEPRVFPLLFLLFLPENTRVREADGINFPLCR